MSRVRPTITSQTASDGTLTDVQNISVDIVNLDELVSIGSAELAPVQGHGRGPGRYDGR